MQEVSVRLNSILNEYGSAHDNPDIFTDEIKKVIRDAMDAIRDGSYLKWDEFKIKGHVLYAKIFWLKETKWMEGVQICLWPGKDIFGSGIAKAAYTYGQLEESGKMSAVVSMFNVKPGHCEDICYDIFIHEFKHAYFDYTKLKSGKVKYHGGRVPLTGRQFPLYDDDPRNKYFDPREKSVPELMKEYEDDREKMSGDVIMELQYIAQDTETAAYAENISL